MVMTNKLDFRRYRMRFGRGQEGMVQQAHNTNGRRGMKSLQGHFLVAGPHQHDPNFAKTVILVVEHSDKGAFGVILNCPSERNQVLPQEQRAERVLSGNAPMLSGGPVAGPLMAVHADQAFAEHEILPGVFFAGKEKNVLHLMQQTKHPCKVFTGYIGWGPGQIEHAIDHGVWQVAPAAADQIFSISDRLWEQLSRQIFEMLVHSLFNIIHIPLDPEWN